MTYHKTLMAALACAALAMPALADDQEDARDAVFQAASTSPASLHQLLANGANINAVDGDGETALMKAASKGQIASVKALIAAGADVNAADEDGETALMMAADEGNSAIVRLLLDAGADINARNKDGETALDMAHDADHRETEEMIRSTVLPTKD